MEFGLLRCGLSRTGSEAQRSDRVYVEDKSMAAARHSFLFVAIKVNPVAPLRFAPGSALRLDVQRQMFTIVPHTSRILT